MSPECETVHIDRANQVTVTAKPAGTARPISVLGLVFMPTCRTPARCASFGAGEAHNMGLCGFVGQVGDILPVLPQRHPLVVMPAALPVAHTVRVADEEAPHVLLDTEVDHCSGRFVAGITP